MRAKIKDKQSAFLIKSKYNAKKLLEKDWEIFNKWI